MQDVGPLKNHLALQTKPVYLDFAVREADEVHWKYKPDVKGSLGFSVDNFAMASNVLSIPVADFTVEFWTKTPSRMEGQGTGGQPANTFLSVAGPGLGKPALADEGVRFWVSTLCVAVLNAERARNTTATLHKQ